METETKRVYEDESTRIYLNFNEEREEDDNWEVEVHYLETGDVFIDNFQTEEEALTYALQSAGIKGNEVDKMETEIKKIENAVEKIESFNDDNISEIQYSDLKDEMEENKELASKIKNIASDLIKNKISYYYSPHLSYNDVSDKDVSSLEAYASFMEEWAENEEEIMIDLARTQENQAKYLFNSLKKIYDYDEEEEFKIIEKIDDIESTPHHATIYTFKNEDKTIILEFSGYMDYYATIDDEKAAKLKEFAENDNIKEFMKIIEEELESVYTDVILARYNTSFFTF